MNWQYDDHYFLCARRVYEKREIVKSWMFVFNTFQLLLLLCNTSICLLIDREWQKNTQRLVSRSSLPEVFFKKGVLRNFTKFTGKHLYQYLFFNGTGVFLWILWNFLEHLFLQKTSGGCFWVSLVLVKPPSEGWIEWRKFCIWELYMLRKTSLIEWMRSVIINLTDLFS